MKKGIRLIVILCLAIITVCGLTSCDLFGNKKTGTNEKPVKVNFFADGEEYAVLSLSKGSKVTLPDDPVKENYSFDGWYLDKDTWEKIFSGEAVSSDVNVYAKFSHVHAEADWVFFSTTTPATEDAEGSAVYRCSVCGATKDVPVPKLLNANLRSAADFTVTEKSGSLVLSNATESYSFTDRIAVSPSATWAIASDENGENVISSNTVPLSVGDNTVYLIVTSGDGKLTSTYTMTIRRRPTFTVSFVLDGEPISELTVEEGSFATAPTPSRDGYSLAAWDYDLSKPILKAETISTTWRANTDTAYKIERYFENILDEEFTLLYTETKTGTTDTTATLTETPYDHFTFDSEASDLTGNIVGDGSLVLKAYYTRNVYAVKFAAGDDNISLSEAVDASYKYGTELAANATANNYLGLEWDGWYIEDDKVAEDASTTFVVDKAATYTAKSKPIAEMLPFKFTSTAATCVVSGMESDYTMPDDLVFPECVTEIAGFPIWATALTMKTISFPSTLKRIGDYAFSDCDSLQTVVIPDNVTSLGYSAFSSCDALESVTIGTGISSFDGGTFVYCRSLTSVTVNSEYLLVYEECSELDFGFCPIKTATVPASMITSILYEHDWRERPYYRDSLETITITCGTIDEYAFRDVTMLPSIMLGNGVTGINPNAFSDCTTTILWGDDPQITSIGDYAFAEYKGTSLTIPDSVTSLGQHAFSDCAATIVWGDTPAITTFTNYTFSNYGGTSLVIPNGVTSLGQYAFPDCAATIVWGDNPGITMIDDYAFAKYKGTTLVIPDSVTSIGRYAFNYCAATIVWGDTPAITTFTNYTFSNYGGTSLVIPESITTIESLAFNGYDLKDVTLSASLLDQIPKENLEHLTVSSGAIGARAFADFPSLGYITFGSGVTSIDEDAFVDHLITVLTLHADVIKLLPAYSPEHLTISAGEIKEEAAFSHCTRVMTVTIGDGVTDIKPYAFNGFNKEVKWGDNPSMTTIGSYAFAGCVGSSIPIPSCVTSIGEYAFKDSTAPVSWRANPSMTVIGDYAFAGYKGTNTLTIPDSIISIGEFAFKDCTAAIEWGGTPTITEIGLNSFRDYKGSTLPIPASVTSIEAFAFAGCDNLTSLTLPDNLSDIQTYAFDSCTKLTTITIPDSVTVIESHAFQNCVASIVWGDHPEITSIEDYAFAAYKGTTLVIPDSVTSIGDSVFENCDKLINITLPSGLTSIGEYAFFHCMASIVWGDSPVIDTIGKNAFYNYKGTALTIPASVTSIGESAFEGCSDLTSLTIPASVTSIGENAFLDWTAPIEWGGTPTITEIGKNAFYNYKGTTFTIPASVTSIGESAFEGCVNITSLTLPSNLQSIGKRAFAGCSAITSFTIPDSVVSIGEDAFADTSFTSATLPAAHLVSLPTDCVTTVTISQGTLGAHAFDSFTALRYLTISSGVIGENVFADNTSLTSITIGNGVADIAAYTFSGCTAAILWGDNLAITSIGEHVFAEYLGTSFTVPNGITSIEDEAFIDCANLATVVISDSVESIGTNAFSNCPISDATLKGALIYAIPKANVTTFTITSGIIGEEAIRDKYPLLATVNIGNGVTEIGNVALAGYAGAVVWGDDPHVTAIGSWAFSGYGGSSLTIPDSVETIGFSVFNGCPNLTSFTIPASVTSIGNYSFGCCEVLTSITILCDLTSIDVDTLLYCPIEDATLSAAFLDCLPKNSVKTLTINHGAIGASQFADFTALTSLTIDRGVTSIDEDAFNGFSLTTVSVHADLIGYLPASCPADVIVCGGVIGEEAFKNCTTLTSITIGNGVTGIGQNAFNGCTATIFWGDDLSITSLGALAFAGYAGANFMISDDITSFEATTFYACRIKNLYIPGSIETIPDWAFYLMADGMHSELEVVTFSEGVKVIGTRAFDHCINLKTIYLPHSLTDINSGAFANCPALETIYYYGDASEWGAVKKHGAGDSAWDYNTGTYSVRYNNPNVK